MSKFAFALIAAFVAANEPNPPTWDTRYVKINPDQNAIDAVWHENGGINNGNHGQWSSHRYALMFTQGHHQVNVNVGFYTQVLGLGATPTDTTLANFWSPNNSSTALCNFWRGVENIGLGNEPKYGNTLWAVS